MVRFLVAMFIFVTLLASQAMAEKRIALVIGNSAYQHVPVLANPRNDAADMAAKLKDLGFEVVSGNDLDLAGVRRTIRDFVNRLDGADMSLFFYAGHGLQVNGENYIAPVDAQLSSSIDLDFETVPINVILSAMERSTKINLVFLDACRDNPLAGNLSRSMGTRSAAVGRGLAKLGSGIGSLIAFATQPGNVALDGEGRNSPFTAALLRHLGTPDQDITRDLVQVRRDVLDSTDGKQVPWETSSLTGDVILKFKPQEEPKPEPGAVVTPLPVEADNTVELAYWDTIKNSDDKDLFEAYIRQYADGPFVSIARVKIAAIKRKTLEAAALAKADKRAAEEASARAEIERRDREKALAQRAELARQQAEIAVKQAQASTTAAAGAVQPQELAALPPVSTQDVLATEAAEPDKELVRSIQKQLNRVGCSAGSADGVWGAGSRRALEQFARRSAIKLDATKPSVQTLGRLQGATSRVCPLVCNRNQKEKNGRCVDTKTEAKLQPAEKKLGADDRPAKNPQTDRKKDKVAGSCPASALIAARVEIRKEFLRRGNFFTKMHECGRKYTCKTLDFNTDWRCSWH